MNNRVLFEVADLLGSLEKTAGIGTWLAGKAKALIPSETVQQGLKGSAKTLYDSAENMMRGLPDRVSPYVDEALHGAGRFIRRGAAASDLRRGIRQIGMATRDGLNQQMFNNGLYNLARGAGKSGLVYGGALYAGSKLAGGPNQNQQMQQMYE